jgi:hypothetical protein
MEFDGSTLRNLLELALTSSIFKLSLCLYINLLAPGPASIVINVKKAPVTHGCREGSAIRGQQCQPTALALLLADLPRVRLPLVEKPQRQLRREAVRSLSRSRSRSRSRGTSRHQQRLLVRLPLGLAAAAGRQTF